MFTHFDALPSSTGVTQTGQALGTFNHANFSDRIKASSTAKSALIDKLKNRPGPDDPRRQAVAAERKAVHDARLARQAEKQRMLLEQREREEAERLKREEEELAAALLREAELEAQRKVAEEARMARASRAVLDMADQKARRDERYAARKSRQKAR
ncbi:DUF6481 family protein [Lichenihabitans sp. Uapishka_5]|uniref:DUF6481 family protein n=1 Tax=Lichenihabitans sp. Uapishka_5 TaxID=3037302 RepID=UPI0029E80CFB|nr:DUF6481 family protein [Lichenihabitans sp. Uapishka_5]MDX7952802.1 DUF6481 family protein [Lichenihabitans sp. Uapishka_5]